MNKLVYAGIVKELVEKDGVEASIIENARNNASAIGIMVKYGGKLAPIFYLDEIEDKAPEDYAEEILSFVPADIDVDKIESIMASKEEVLKRVYYILVNAKLNENRQDIVKKKVCDSLELHFKIDISDVQEGSCIPVTDTHITNLGINDLELYYMARRNTPKMFPACIYEMSEILGMPADGCGLYVLTNKDKYYGAGTVMYRGIKKQILDTVGGDFILLPSSVHEWIIVPAEYGDIEVMTKMIRDINENIVADEDILSDRPYKFDGTRLVLA